LATEKENLRLLRSERSAKRKKTAVACLLGLMTLGAAGLGGYHWHTQQENQLAEKEAQQEFDAYRAEAESLVIKFQKERDDALAKEAKSLETKVKLQNFLSKQEGQSDVALASAYQTNETLLDWALEEGIENLPILEGRDERLGILYDQLNEQLKSMEGQSCCRK